MSTHRGWCETKWGICAAAISPPFSPATFASSYQKPLFICSVTKIIPCQEILYSYYSWPWCSYIFNLYETWILHPFINTLWWYWQVSNMGVTSILVGNGVTVGALRQGLTKYSENVNTSEKNKQKWRTKFSKNSSSSEQNEKNWIFHRCWIMYNFKSIDLFLYCQGLSCDKSIPVMITICCINYQEIL